MLTKFKTTIWQDKVMRILFLILVALVVALISLGIAYLLKDNKQAQEKTYTAEDLYSEEVCNNIASSIAALLTGGFVDNTNHDLGFYFDGNGNYTGYINKDNEKTSCKYKFTSDASGVILAFMNDEEDIIQTYYVAIEEDCSYVLTASDGSESHTLVADYTLGLSVAPKGDKDASK